MVNLSDVAAEKLRAILVEEKAEEKGLRIRVVPGGCSGFSYDMIFDDKAEGDQVFEAGGVRLLVDGESLPLLEGATIGKLSPRAPRSTSRKRAYLIA